MRRSSRGTGGPGHTLASTSGAGGRAISPESRRAAIASPGATHPVDATQAPAPGASAGPGSGAWSGSIAHSPACRGECASWLAAQPASPAATSRAEAANAMRDVCSAIGGTGVRGQIPNHRSSPGKLARIGPRVGCAEGSFRRCRVRATLMLTRGNPRVGDHNTPGRTRTSDLRFQRSVDRSTGWTISSTPSTIARLVVAGRFGARTRTVLGRLRGGIAGAAHPLVSTPSVGRAPRQALGRAPRRRLGSGLPSRAYAWGSPSSPGSP